MQPSKAFSTVLKDSLLGGRFAEAQSLLAKLRGEMTPAEGAYLEALLEFQAGRIREPGAAKLWERGVWRWLTASVRGLFSRFDPIFKGDKQPLVSRGLIDIKQDESILERLTDVVNQGGPQAAAELIKTIFGGASVDAVRRPNHNLTRETFAVQSLDDRKVEVLVHIDRHETLVFTVVDPVANFKFDEKIAGYLNLAASIIQAAAAKQALVEAEKSRAIAQTTQMLAHDVRKPFSMLQGMLSVLASTADPVGATQMARRFLPEVEKAIASVNGLIQDVMEVGVSAPPRLEPVDIERLIETALVDVVRLAHGVDVRFRYDFGHAGKIVVDPTRFLRVLSNIFENAVQAAPRAGEIWVATRTLSAEGRSYTEITVGNSGSYIPPEATPYLFEAFFTKDKKGGTGLGLAIAKKIVEGHGGKIWCVSSREKGTEFIFTVEAAPLELRSFDGNLPSASQDVEKLNQAADIGAEASESVWRDDLAIEGQILEASKERGPVRIMIADDEMLYRDILKEQLERRKTLADAVHLCFVASGEEAVAAAKAFAPDLVVMDVDFGRGKISGFDAVGQLRAGGVKAKILIHSNRGALEYNSAAQEIGADIFVPKPMSRTHFLKFILSALPKVEQKASSRDPDAGHLIVLDDSPLLLWAWTDASKLRKIRTFSSPEEFWSAAAEDASLLADSNGVVTDNYFDEASDETGLSFAKALRHQGYAKPIFLATDADIPPEDYADFIDLRIAKDPLEAWRAIDAHGHPSI